MTIIGADVLYLPTKPTLVDLSKIKIKRVGQDGAAHRSKGNLRGEIRTKVGPRPADEQSTWQAPWVPPIVCQLQPSLVFVSFLFTFKLLDDSIKLARLGPCANFDQG